MKQHILSLAQNSGLLRWLLLTISHIVPGIGKLKKIKNALQFGYYCYNGKTVIASNPLSVRVAPASVCNYRCLFCEIHKDNSLYPDRAKNLMTMSDFKNYESFLSTAWGLSFYGGSEEPLLNKNITEL